MRSEEQKPAIPSSTQASPQAKATWFRATSASSIGIEIAVCIGAGTAFANYAEREWTHWAPWTTLIGFLVGLAAAVKALIRTAKQVKRELAQMDLTKLPKGDYASIDAAEKKSESDKLD